MPTGIWTVIKLSLDSMPRNNIIKFDKVPMKTLQLSGQDADTTSQTVHNTRTSHVGTILKGWNKIEIWTP